MKMEISVTLRKYQILPGSVSYYLLLSFSNLIHITLHEEFKLDVVGFKIIMPFGEHLKIFE